MGYRVSIEHVNALGHLVEGNTLTFLEQSFASEDRGKTSFQFLDSLIKKNKKLYMDEEEWHRFRHEFRWLRHEWEELRHEWKELRYTWEENRHVWEMLRQEWDRGDRFHRYFNIVSYLAILLSGCHYKSILLPGFNYSELNTSMINERLLKDLVQIHPGRSSLVIQLDHLLIKEKLTILNVFPRFDAALTQIDKWPGVLLWDQGDTIFIPIKSEKEIKDIFLVMRAERRAIPFLRNRYSKNIDDSKNTYFFHLSDLHFGNKLANRRMNRVIQILRNQIDLLGDDSKVLPIITGDLMDSPNDENKQSYDNFIYHLNLLGIENHIHILGNHDVANNGIVLSNVARKSLLCSLLDESSVVKYDDIKLVVIKFKSSWRGALSQGKIGDKQLSEIGCEIDRIPNKHEYTFIGILHHHPVKIKEPDWYEKKWYEKVLGDYLVDRSLILKDADVFMQWLKERNVKLVLHGHKHIPNISPPNDVRIIAAGSLTGMIKHRERHKTYMTFNVIKYNLEEQKPVLCTVVAEEIEGAGERHVHIEHL